MMRHEMTGGATNLRRMLFLGVVGIVQVLTTSARCRADQPPAYLVRIPLPITGNIDERVKREVEQLIGAENLSSKRPILVLEFWPPDDVDQAAFSQFERCLSLANYLASDRLSKIRTVAYLPRTVVGHAVLPVMACEEIVMHPDAKLGDAGRTDTAISPMVRSAYREIANRRRTIPEAVALGMLDKKLKVWKVATPDGMRFALDEDLDRIRQDTVVDELQTLVEPGAAGIFSGSQLRQDCGIVGNVASDRQELSEILGVPVGELEPDPSRGGAWSAVRVDLTGLITNQAANRVQKVMEDALLARKPNLLCVVIDSPGGSPEASLRMANYLSQLDASEVRTVAYVTHEARADAALVAWSMDHLVIEQTAVLGGPGAHQPSPQEVQDTTMALQQIAKLKSKHWSIPAAMIDQNLAVEKYGLPGTDVVAYFCPQELAQQPDPGKWNKTGELSRAGELLSLSGNQAELDGLARFAVQNFEEFRQLYQLTDDPTLLKPNWAHELVEYLAAPQFAAALVFFAFLALTVELSSPGLGVGGFVAAVCVVLFFWSQFLHGTATWLEILMFLTGIAFLVLELFVLPGFGVFGVGGIALLVGSIVLASQTFIIPRNAYQFEQFPQSLLILVSGGVGLGLGVIVLSRFLDRAPLLRHMMLPPPGSALTDDSNSNRDYARLLHQRGVAATPLMPSGKARFGTMLVDVVTDGIAIDAGTPLEVVQVTGHRVVVQPLE